MKRLNTITTFQNILLFLKADIYFEIDFRSNLICDIFNLEKRRSYIQEFRIIVKIKCLTTKQSKVNLHKTLLPLLSFDAYVTSKLPLTCQKIQHVFLFVIF